MPDIKKENQQNALEENLNKSTDVYLKEKRNTKVIINMIPFHLSWDVVLRELWYGLFKKKSTHTDTRAHTHITQSA